MDWNSIKLLIAIAECGSLAGAARQLKVNHSTVFRRLNDLEKQLATRLFERLPQGYELTALGQAAYQKAIAINEGFADFERTLLARDSELIGSVKITAPDNIAFKYLPRYLAKFEQDFPKIKAEILVSNTEVNLNQRQADIAIRACPKVPEHLIGSLLTEIPWYFYCSKKNTRAQELVQSHSDLIKFELIGGASWALNLPAFQWLEKHYSANVGHRVDNLFAMSTLAEHTNALALLPADQARDELYQLALQSSFSPTKLWLLTHPDLRKTERVRVLMQFLRECFKEERFGG